MEEKDERSHWVMPPSKMSLLVSRQRHRIMPPTKTLRALGLKRGMTLLDVGCGPGFFTIPGCRVVGKGGQVFACDTSPMMLRAVRKKVKDKDFHNVTFKESKDPEIPFLDSCADLVMVSFVLHETKSIKRFLVEALRVLRPGGQAVVMEWHPRLTEYGPPLGSRLSTQETKREMRAAGFSISDSWDFDDDTYFVVGRDKQIRSRTSPFKEGLKQVRRRRG